MLTLLTHDDLITRYRERLESYEITPLTLPAEPGARLSTEQLGRIDAACFIGMWEADSVFTRRFLGSALQAPRLRWMHLPNAGVDHPVFHQLLAKGVRLTTSSGASAEPIAQTAIGGLLALARGFPAWSAAQQRHEWAPHRHLPRDLRGQSIVIVGVGAIGNEIARLARALGMYVIGVRRSPQRSTDQVDEMLHPAQLVTAVTRADWLVLACPLNVETRGLVDARTLASLPAQARVINVARGAVIDEAALIDALRSGHVSGAYLDVFEPEPLPPDSPLWDLPNVIVSPHDAGVADGNSGRVAEIFFDNLERWRRGDVLRNEVTAVPE